jgi:hypothetical protein
MAVCLFYEPVDFGLRPSTKLPAFSDFTQAIDAFWSVSSILLSPVMWAYLHVPDFVGQK